MTVLVATVGQFPSAYGDDQNTYDTMVEVLASQDADISVIDDDESLNCWIEPRAVERMFARIRNRAAQEALSGGYSHLFLVENDVVLRSETLPALLAHGVDIVAPRVMYEEPRFDIRAYLPRDEGLGGLVEKECTVMSAILFSRHAMEQAEPLITNVYGEQNIFRHWQDAGLRTFLDKDTPVDLLALPGNWLKAEWDMRVRDATKAAKAAGTAVIMPELPRAEVRARFRGLW